MASISVETEKGDYLKVRSASVGEARKVNGIFVLVPVSQLSWISGTEIRAAESLPNTQ
jgi:hypothetical protein